MGKQDIGIAILGGTGYGAGELLRLLTAHPTAEVVSVVSSSQAETPITSAHSHLSGFYSLPFSSAPDFEKLSRFNHQIIFASLPHGTSSKEIATLVAANPQLKVIDLSGDLRLKNETAHNSFYGDVPFNSELRSQFVYGLPETSREQIRRSKYVANPGCLATASALAVLPLVKNHLIDSVVMDAKTGASGAGKTPQPSMHHPTRHGNFEAYKMLSHRHEAEIAQTFFEVGGENIDTMFVPHLLPTARGIFVTAYATLKQPLADASVLYKAFYQEHPFIRFRDGSPNLHDVLGTNFCDLSVKTRGNQIVAMTALDNLVKGMAGQALQNMNLMCGLEETTGLMLPSLGTV